jgi:hypothetical protein
MRNQLVRGGALALALSGLTVLAASAEAPKRAFGSGPGSAAATGAAAEVLASAKDYRSWSKFPEYTAAKPSKSHGGNHVVAWYNAVAAPAVKAAGQDFPDGSVIVKENRVSPEAAPGSLSIMAKRSGSWFWVSATTDGKVFTADGAPLAGDLGECAGCHMAADRDMVFSK